MCKVWKTVAKVRTHLGTFRNILHTNMNERRINENNLRQRPAWRSMSGVCTSTIALYVLRVRMVWEVLYNRVLPVGAGEGRTCGQWKWMCKLWENVSEIGTYCA